MSILDPEKFKKAIAKGEAALRLVAELVLIDTTTIGDAEAKLMLRSFIAAAKAIDQS